MNVCLFQSELIAAIRERNRRRAMLFEAAYDLTTTALLIGFSVAVFVGLF